MPLEELQQAVSENRLPLLPTERALAGDPRHTIREAAERTGLPEELVVGLQQALGMPASDPDARVLSDEDLEAVERLRRFLDAGLPADGILEVGRVIGRAMEQVSAATRQLVAEALLRPGDTELDLASRLADTAGELAPLMGSLLEHQYRLRLREGLRRDAVDPEALEAGELPGSVEVAVGFADLVGFTRLGERLPAADLGRLAGRLAEMAEDVAEPPVQLVKTIGDAAMLASRDTGPLVDALLELVTRADEASDDGGFPQVSAGAARGHALARGGDWYGRPVNLASRITDVARPGSVLVAREVRDELRVESEDDDPYRWSRAPARRLKGVEGRVALYRVRRRPAEDDEPGG